MHETLKLALLVAGFLHLIPLTAGLSVPQVLSWRQELERLNPLTRQLIWVHGAFIVLTVVGFGAISLIAAESMLQGTILGVAVAGFMGLFWGLRLCLQLFFFNARPWLTTLFRKLGYRTLTCLFAYFVVVYFLAAAFNVKLIWQL
jgi:hypothetical protein